MEKIFIPNRYGQKLAVLVEELRPQVGLAVVMHGLGGFKEQEGIQAFAESFKEAGFTVVRWDAAHTLGESEGDYQKATITTYYEDLMDVIGWAKTQPWFVEPFALCGHSLGGICTALYTQNYPEQVKLLAPISTVVSGELSLAAHRRYDPEGLQRWQETGWEERDSRSKPGMVKRLPWSHMEDRQRYDLLSGASKLVMPVLLIVGENDQSTPPDHHQILFEALPGPKEMHIIKGAQHTFRLPEHLAEIKSIFKQWLEKYGRQ